MIGRRKLQTRAHNRTAAFGRQPARRYVVCVSSPVIHCFVGVSIRVVLFHIAVSFEGLLASLCLPYEVSLFINPGCDLLLSIDITFHLLLFL